MRTTSHRSESLEKKVDTAIRQKAKSAVRDLAVTSDDTRVVLHGRTSSYYLAQLALSAAQKVLRSASDTRPLRTKIIVDPVTS